MLPTAFPSVRSARLIHETPAAFPGRFRNPGRFRRLASGALIAMLAFAAAPKAHAARTLNVVGTAEILAFPDQADLILEAEAIRPKAKAAMDEAQAAVRGLFALCARYASDSADLTSGQIGVEKQYRWVKNTQVFAGYRATQTLTLRLKDLNRLGELMEAVSGGKLTRLEGVYYSHSAMDSLERAAQGKALEHARLSAETLAKGAGGALGEALWIGNHRPPESGAGAGMDGVLGNASMAFGGMERKAKQAYLMKPDRLTVTGMAYAVYELRSAKVPPSRTP